jgi:DNA-binding PadR family transcriptional regulator
MVDATIHRPDATDMPVPKPAARAPDPAEFLPLKARDYEILFVLAREELHGYGLVKEIEARTDGMLSLEPASLYRRLRKLMADGLVEEAGERPSADADDERRRYHRITPSGRAVLRAEAVRMRSLVREAEAERLLPARPRTG